jgi:putative spermidine/putrescine transport system ATP-binding protein
MSVFENVAFPLRQRRRSRTDIRELVQDVLDRFGLAGFETRKPAELSGGQRQRVALARATVFEPSVLLLDEPLGALDRKLRAQLQAEIKKLHRELGLTFVFVTHDQDEAMFLSDKIAVFNKGRIERVGSPTELYDEPGTQFVAQFLGEANVFAGAASADGYLWNGELLRTDAPVDRQDAMLMVRPENVVVGDRMGVPDGWNALRATVVDVSQLGASTRVDLRFDAGGVGTARLDADPAISWRPGDVAWAAWAPGSQRFVMPDAVVPTRVAVAA